MKIFGIGTDIVNIKRMEKILKKNGKDFKSREFFQKVKLTTVKRKKILFLFTLKDLRQKKH